MAWKVRLVPIDESMRRMTMRLGLLLFSLIALGGPAAAQQWQVIAQPGGYKVARVVSTGAVGGMALTCERGVPILAIQLVRPAPRDPAPATMTVGDRSIRLALTRNRASNVWAASLRDRTLLDAIMQAAGGARLVIVVDGGQTGVMPLQGVREAMQAALGGCYAAAVGTLVARGDAPSAAGAGHDVFEDVSLPPAVRTDLADFDASCHQDNPVLPSQGEKPRGGRGRGLAQPGAVLNADFNGDGAPDFVIDTARLHCSRPQPEDVPDRTLLVYTSQAGGVVQPTADIPFDRYRIVPGAKAAIRVHQDAVDEADEGGSSRPARDETMTMTSLSRWSNSEIAEPNWRVGYEQSPTVIRDLFSLWDQACAALGRRIQISSEPGSEAVVATVDEDVAGKTKTFPVDLNGDGRRDYVIDTSVVSCGLFGVPPKPGWTSEKAFCGPDCTLIAIVSRPKGGYAVQPVPKSITLIGNGDPAELKRIGTKTLLCFPDYAQAKPPLIRYSWDGIVAQKAIRPWNSGCR